MSNELLKKEIKESGVFQWQIADVLNISEMTLVRKLRYELTNEQKQNIREIIKQIKN